ncbi:MAG: VanZ family protein [Phycisphaerae bacterium]|nr:VanZ family protein [Phycisphaerae bacterium]
MTPTLEDFVVNLLVHLPMGFTLFGGLSRWLHRRSWAILAATAGAAGLSLGLETRQTFSTARWASWVEVLLNASGGLAGAVMAPGIGQAAEGVAGIARVRADCGSRVCRAHARPGLPCGG